MTPSFQIKPPGLVLFMFATLSALAAPFTPRGPEEAYGAGSTAWRFTSTLSKDASGVIEICYAEEGSLERVLGRVEVRPFQSSTAVMPDLRILFTKTEVDGKPRLVLLVGYGIRSGVFVVEVPNLSQHSLAVAGSPSASESGEYNLLGYGDRISIRRDGAFSGHKGRLFFRYIDIP